MAMRLAGQWAVQTDVKVAVERVVMTAQLTAGLKGALTAESLECTTVRKMVVKKVVQWAMQTADRSVGRWVVVRA